jgi:uncharacterized membrane protein YidH (DUF202 family)
MANISATIGDFCDSTIGVCSCIAISAIFILLFMFSLPHSGIVSTLVKMIAIFIIAFGIYFNFTQTNKFVNNLNINIWNNGEEWTPLKTNVLSSYLLTLFLLFLLVSVIIRLF